MTCSHRLTALQGRISAVVLPSVRRVCSVRRIPSLLLGALAHVPSQLGWDRAAYIRSQHVAATGCSSKLAFCVI